MRFPFLRKSWVMVVNDMPMRADIRGNDNCSRPHSSFEVLRSDKLGSISIYSICLALVILLLSDFSHQAFVSA
jgi:hypothetical protein